MTGILLLINLIIIDKKDDIYIGQNTWTALQTMNRVYKVYDLPLHMENGEIIPGRLQGFSSYPARISSGDDYYTIGDHMVVPETTIGFTNPELYRYMNGKAVMQWARNLLANRLAKYDSDRCMINRSPKDWCLTMAKYNNGCYPNQWMILDYDYLVEGKGLKEGGFYIIELIPGFYHYQDMSEYCLLDEVMN